ncbi:MAG: DUF2382 domain-containing protein [Propionibacteriaceae bacterium]
MSDLAPTARQPDDPQVIIRSEEQLSVARSVRRRGGIRIRKRVRTEQVTQTVEVRREELVLDELSPEELMVSGSAAAEPHELSERDLEIVLHEERVVVTTEVVAVERVRVRTRIVTDQVAVSDSVQRERIEPLAVLDEES